MEDGAGKEKKELTSDVNKRLTLLEFLTVENAEPSEQKWWIIPSKVGWKKIHGEEREDSKNSFGYSQDKTRDLVLFSSVRVESLG